MSTQQPDRKSTDKPTIEELETLAKQIEQDQNSPSKPAEKQLKIDAPFDQTLKAIVKVDPKKLEK